MVIGLQALAYCYCLRNVAFPPNAVFNDTVLFDDEYHQRTDLYAEIISEMQHRFDGLPIHSLIYYQSYHDGVLQRLLAAINMSSGQRRTLRSKLDPTGNQQDCLGMTPLHILACSSVHDLELYRLIVAKYPTNLITEDRWGVRYHCCMHFGVLHQLRLSRFCSRTTSHSTLITYSTGQ